MTIKREYYEILGIAKTASQKEVEEAYRKLAIQHHPDRVPADKKDEARAKFKPWKKEKTTEEPEENKELSQEDKSSFLAMWQQSKDKNKKKSEDQAEEEKEKA